MNDKRWYIRIDGEDIAVTEEVYRAYKRPAWAEHKRREREKRCRDSSGNRCTEDCSTCPKDREGGALSLDRLVEDGYEAPDQLDVAEQVEDALLKEALRAALMSLTDEERFIVTLAFQGRTEREAAAEAEMPRKTFVYRRDKIVDKLKKLMNGK